MIGRLVSTWTASEWLTNTGTRTAVHETRRSGRCRILRLSVTTFHSSFVYPLSRNTSMCGRALNAIGCGYTEATLGRPSAWALTCSSSSTIALWPVPATDW